MTDDSNVIGELRRELAEFRDARSWGRFHEPQALAQAISVEAGELSELFLWGASPPTGSVALELADVMIYCLNMANTCDIDVTTAVRAKMVINAEKYSV